MKDRGRPAAEKLTGTQIRYLAGGREGSPGKVLYSHDAVAGFVAVWRKAIALG